MLDPWSIAVIDSIKPSQAKNSLKEAILEGRGVFHFPSTRPSMIPSPSQGVLNVLWLKAQTEGHITVLKMGHETQGPSPGSVLHHLPRARRAPFLSPLKGRV